MGHTGNGYDSAVMSATASHAQWKGYTRPARWVMKQPCTRKHASKSSESAEEAASMQVASEHMSEKVVVASNPETVDKAPVADAKVNSDAPEKEACAMDVEVPHAGDDFLAGLGLTLEGLVRLGNTQQGKVSHFHCVRAPPMGVKEYLKRIRKYFQCSDECFVITLIILDRVGKVDSSLMLCELNVHRLLVSAVMLAAKFHDDVYYSNAFYAKVGGLGLKEMNQLEARLLKLLNWKVNVSPQEYHEYLRIVCEASRGQCAGLPQVKKEPEPEP
jgi:hypothetical protein